MISPSPFSVPRRYIRIYIEGYLELEEDSSHLSNPVAEASEVVVKAVAKLYEIPFKVIKAYTQE